VSEDYPAARKALNELREHHHVIDADNLEQELSDLKEMLRVAEEEKQRWANCCGEMIMTCHTCKELSDLKEN